MPTKKTGPSKHPYPPPNFPKMALPFTKCRGPWFRLHYRRKGPLVFNWGNNYRFNAPSGEFGILYLSYDANGAFIETFGWNTGKKKAISYTELNNRLLEKVISKNELNLVDLTGEGLARIGADARVCTGENFKLSQKWSLAFWNHPSNPDGIKYVMRHDPSKTGVALYSRNNVITSLSAKGLGALLDHSNLGILIDCLNRYNFSLL